MAQTFQLTGQYLKPDGTPHQGFITVNPVPLAVQDVVTGTVITLQAARLDMDENGIVSAELIDPNDPGLRPGGEDGNQWPYCIRETFQGGAVIGWYLTPENITGPVVDLGTVPRVNPNVYRPADWFPHHWADTPSQAGRISS